MLLAESTKKQLFFFPLSLLYHETFTRPLRDIHETFTGHERSFYGLLIRYKCFQNAIELPHKIKHSCVSDLLNPLYHDIAASIILRISRRNRGSIEVDPRTYAIKWAGSVIHNRDGERHFYRSDNTVPAVLQI